MKKWLSVGLLLVATHTLYPADPIPLLTVDPKPLLTKLNSQLAELHNQLQLPTLPGEPITTTEEGVVPEAPPLPPTPPPALGETQEEVPVAPPLPPITTTPAKKPAAPRQWAPVEIPEAAAGETKPQQARRPPKTKAELQAERQKAAQKKELTEAVARRRQQLEPQVIPPQTAASQALPRLGQIQEASKPTPSSGTLSTSGEGRGSGLQAAPVADAAQKAKQRILKEMEAILLPASLQALALQLRNDWNKLIGTGPLGFSNVAAARKTAITFLSQAQATTVRLNEDQKLAMEKIINAMLQFDPQLLDQAAEVIKALGLDWQTAYTTPSEEGQKLEDEQAFYVNVLANTVKKLEEMDLKTITAGLRNDLTDAFVVSDNIEAPFLAAQVKLMQGENGQNIEFVHQIEILRERLYKLLDGKIGDALEDQKQLLQAINQTEKNRVYCFTRTTNQFRDSYPTKQKLNELGKAQYYVYLWLDLERIVSFIKKIKTTDEAARTPLQQRAVARTVNLAARAIINFVAQMQKIGEDWCPICFGQDIINDRSEKALKQIDEFFNDLPAPHTHMIVKAQEAITFLKRVIPQKDPRQGIQQEDPYQAQLKQAQIICANMKNDPEFREWLASI